MQNENHLTVLAYYPSLLTSFFVETLGVRVNRVDQEKNIPYFLTLFDPPLNKTNIFQIDIDLSQKGVLSGTASWFYLTKPVNQDQLDRSVGEGSSSGNKAGLQHRITFSTFDSKKVT
eukprot:sb/3476569/